jgi:hypothetical protein
MTISCDVDRKNWRYLVARLVWSRLAMLPVLESETLAIMQSSWLKKVTNEN